MGSLVDLEGVRMLVTGGASGIGAATVEMARELGARVGVVDLSPSTSPSADISVNADISSVDEATEAVGQIHNRLGGLDVLVNNAGIAPTGVFEELTERQWHQTLAVNLDGLFYCTRAAIPLLRKAPAGVIVNMASIAGRSRSRTASVAYATSKGGVIALTRQLAFELASEGIRVNCVCPGLVDTQIMSQNVTAKRLQELVATIPLGRLGSPSEVAALVCFLSSGASSYLTGTIVDINGGLS